MKKFLLLIICSISIICCSKEQESGIERFEGKYSGTCEYTSDIGSSNHTITVKVQISSNTITVRSVSGFALPTRHYNITKEYDTCLQGYIPYSNGYASISIYENSLYIEDWKPGERYVLNLGKD